MQPLFFVPGITRQSLKLDALGLETMGLDHLNVGEGMGPHGKSGVLLWWNAPAHPLQSPAMEKVAEMQWVAAKPDPDRGLAGERFYLGKLPGDVIRPADLARPRQQDGLEVRLDDGQQWLVPVARLLPHEHVLDEAGREIDCVQPQYVRLFELANQFCNKILHAASDRLTIGDAKVLAREALTLNYRLCRDLIDWLGILRTDDTLFWAAGATFELQRWVAIAEQKKNLPSLTPAS